MRPKTLKVLRRVDFCEVLKLQNHRNRPSSGFICESISESSRNQTSEELGKSKSWDLRFMKPENLKWREPSMWRWTRDARSRTLEEKRGGKGPKTRWRSRSLVEEGAERPSIGLRRPKSLGGRRTIDWGGRMADDLPFQRNLSKRNERLRTKTSEGRTPGGNRSHTSEVTGVSRSSTSEDSYWGGSENWELKLSKAGRLESIVVVDLERSYVLRDDGDMRSCMKKKRGGRWLDSWPEVGKE